MKRIVCIGGGTGLSNILAGLKKYTNNLSAIVTMSDDGYSSGRLRQDLGASSAGDVRKCLASLANDEALMTKMFQYRFDKGKGIAGHSLGNLFLAALENVTGSFREAVNQASHILAIQGEVLPSTFDDVKLSAKLKNGREIIGQYLISHKGHESPIKKVYLKPRSAKPNPDVLWAIDNAEKIIIGPGSLYTSVIPNLLIKQICQHIVKSKAKKIYVCNVSTERGETEKYTVEDHILNLIRHSDPKIFDISLVNDAVININHDEGKYGKVSNISTDVEKIGRYKIVKKDIINIGNPLYHDREKLAKAIMEV